MREPHAVFVDLACYGSLDVREYIDSRFTIALGMGCFSTVSLGDEPH
ncbi:hypothetical protein [Chania multitudinisentens]|nr:hypothetical protein [Chania multitudinisentens]